MSGGPPCAPLAACVDDDACRPPISLTVRPGLERSILSVLLCGHDSVEEPYQHPLVRFFTTREAARLRLAHPELAAAVSAARFSGRHHYRSYFERVALGCGFSGAPKKGLLSSWRRCFPSAEWLWIGSRGVFDDVTVAAEAGGLSTLRALVVKCGGGLVVDFAEATAILTRALPRLVALETLLFDVWLTCDSDVESLYGLVRALVLAITDAAAPPLVRRNACCALAGIASGLDNFGVTACVESGAVSALVAVLRAHASDVVVARHASGALEAIAEGRGRESEAHQETCVEAGAVPALVAALCYHNAPSEAACLDAGGGAAAARCGRSSCVAAATQRLLGALKNIACCTAGQLACLAAGAMPAIVSVLLAHSANTSVCDDACKALSKVARTDAARDACVQAGAVPLLVAFLRARPLEFHDGPISALLEIARSPAGKAAFDAAGAAKPVMESMYDRLRSPPRQSVDEVLALAGLRKRHGRGK